MRLVTLGHGGRTQSRGSILRRSSGGERAVDLLYSLTIALLCIAPPLLPTVDLLSYVLSSVALVQDCYPLPLAASCLLVRVLSFARLSPLPPRSRFWGTVALYWWNRADAVVRDFHAVPLHLVRSAACPPREDVMSTRMSERWKVRVWSLYGVKSLAHMPHAISSPEFPRCSSVHLEWRVHESQHCVCV